MHPWSVPYGLDDGRRLFLPREAALSLLFVMKVIRGSHGHNAATVCLISTNPSVRTVVRFSFISIYEVILKNAILIYISFAK